MGNDLGRRDHGKEGDNVYQLMRGGWARWKVENETFNTLKNQGYNTKGKGTVSFFEAGLRSGRPVDNGREAPR